ncbi:ABC-three component system middle component 1 [Vreelandella janggokensis]|uniref:ABC-three component system middle component 1 n=1 Tax=Vreelandella janggokensis TaxID=370767 RepID=UPI002854BEFF|nr:ABC-three component system middle component 1 [Halomonas janggokensis]MDR5886300.1 hypothetical protein [Halomonas janggokensis]
MIDVLNNIVSSNGYKLVDADFSLDIAVIYLFCPIDKSKREEYFVTMQFNNQCDETAEKLLEVKAEELFEKISHSKKVDISFEKNCTMLICQDEDKISREIILALEEDQYNFKKNVIAYSQQELDSAKNYLDKNKISEITSGVINEIINSNDGKLFLEFKYQHKSKRDYYSLMLKIVLKLPFITYRPQDQQLVNLSHEIESSLTSEQYLIYDQLVNSDMEWKDEDFYQKVEKVWGGLG